MRAGEREGEESVEAKVQRGIGGMHWRHAFEESTSKATVVAIPAARRESHSGGFPHT